MPRTYWKEWAIAKKSEVDINLEALLVRETSPTTVVITCRNKSAVLPIVIRALARQIERPDQIVLADDNSDDDSVSVFRKNCMEYDLQYQVSVLPPGDPYRLNSVRNLGFSRARSGLVICIDSDLKVGPGFVATHRRIHSECSSICISTGPILESANPDGTGPTNYMWGHESFAHISHKPGSPLPTWSTVLGGNLGIHRKVWELVGGFDESYNGGYGADDQDFYYRFSLTGGNIIGDFEAYVIHMPHDNVLGTERDPWVNLVRFEKKYGFSIYDGIIPQQIQWIGWCYSPWNKAFKRLLSGDRTALVTQGVRKNYEEAHKQIVDELNQIIIEKKRDHVNLQPDLDGVQAELDSAREERDGNWAIVESTRQERYTAWVELDRVCQVRNQNREYFEEARRELDSIRKSFSFKIGNFVVRLFPASFRRGLLQLRGLKKKSVFAANDQMSNQEAQKDFGTNSVRHSKGTKWSDLSPKEKALSTSLRRNPGPVAIINPEWLGIRKACLNLFDHVYELKDNLDELSSRRSANFLRETGCRAVVIHSFPQSYRYLVEALNQLEPIIPVFVVWHGTFMRMSGDYEWNAFRTAVELCKSGKIKKIGFAKKGQSEILMKQGITTGFVMNRIVEIPERPSTPLSEGPHLGIWTLFDLPHKPPYEMIGAASMVKNAHVHMSGASSRAQELCDFLQIAVSRSGSAVPQDEMPKKLADMHINLYVTFNECAPILPLESLSVGVPCIFGPNTYYFEDHEYLKSRLIVNEPDSAHSIARHINMCLEERLEIIEAYRCYAPEYNERVVGVLKDFLEL